MDENNNPPDNVSRTVAVIPCAGAGRRMGTGVAKQFLELKGRPLLALTLEKFQASRAVDTIVLVVPRKDIEFCEREIVERYGFDKVGKVIAGGERRQDSVRLGVEASGGNYDLVLVHDGVRPFVETSLIDRVIEAAGENRAVITALPVKETVKEIDGDNRVIKTVDRNHIRLAQTPQVFRYADILEAHRKALVEGWGEVTDDAFMIEKMGIPVKVIAGSETNIKITTVSDMDFGRYLLEKN